MEFESSTKPDDLQINDDKIKYMVIIRAENRDKILKRFTNFKYLGATITSGNDVTKEINNRI